MIQSIHLSHLRNSEFIQFCRNFTSIIDASNPSALLVQPQYDAAVLKIVEIEGLFKTATINPLTAEMEALDFRRDQALNGIITNINSFSYHFDETFKSAATILLDNLKVYSAGIARENYQSETAIINKLIRDWENKPELITAIDKLNLSSWITELKTANEDFDQKYLDRTRDYGSASPDNLKSKRAEMLTAYYNLRKRLNAYAEIEGTELYVTTMNNLNALIEQYNALLNARLKPRTNKKKSAEETNSN